MSWQDDVMAEQEQADALNYIGEAEWRNLYKDLEEKAKLTCEWEITTQTEDDFKKEAQNE